MRQTSCYSCDQKCDQKTLSFVCLPVRITPGWCLRSLTSLTWTTSSMLEPRRIWKEVRHHAGDEWEMRDPALLLKWQWAQIAFKRTLWLFYYSQVLRIKGNHDMFSVTPSELAVVLNSKVWLEFTLHLLLTWTEITQPQTQNCKEKSSMTFGATVQCTVTSEGKKTLVDMQNSQAWNVVIAAPLFFF